MNKGAGIFVCRRQKITFSIRPKNDPARTQIIFPSIMPKKFIFLHYEEVYCLSVKSMNLWTIRGSMDKLSEFYAPFAPKMLWFTAKKCAHGPLTEGSIARKFQLRCSHRRIFIDSLVFSGNSLNQRVSWDIVRGIFYF
jgi:hypothetical protein